MSKITENIYLSGVVAAATLRDLEINKVQHVLNLCGDLMPEPVNPLIRNYIIYLKDASWESLESIMYNCFTYIHDARTKNENILVHC